MKKVLVTLLAIAIILNGIVLVNAQQQQEVIGNVNFFQKILHLLYGSQDIGIMSAIGQNRKCDISPLNSGHVQPNQNMNLQASTYCSSGQSLFDVYYSDNGGNSYTPYKEYKNSVNFLCGSNHYDCYWEVYCCSKPECSSNSDCVNWYGSGYQCVLGEKDAYISYDANYYYCKGSTEGQSCQASNGCLGTIQNGQCVTNLQRCSGGSCLQTCDGGGNGGNGGCTSNWQCGSWGSCNNNQQIRTCTDLNGCKSVYTETQSCSSGNGGGGGTNPPNFQVSIINSPSSISSEDEATVSVKVKNLGGTGTMRVEAGYYSDAVLSGWGLQSIFNIVDNCEPTERNVQTLSITLDENEEKVYNFTFDIPKLCEDSELPISGFDFYTSAYINCYNTGQATGLTSYARKNVITNYDTGCQSASCTNGIKENDESDTDCGGRCTAEGKQCPENYRCFRTDDCKSGLACDLTSKNMLGAGICKKATNVALYDENAKQEGIEADKIKEMTSKDLLKSICASTDECEEGSTCKSLNFLIDEGFLTEKEADDKISGTRIALTSAGFLTAGVITAGAVSAACAGIVEAVSLGTATPIVPLCFLIGFGVGGGTGAILGDKFAQTIIEWNKGDKSAAGYCIIEKKGLSLDNFFDWLEEQGISSKDKELVGWGIIIGGIILLLFLFTKK